MKSELGLGTIEVVILVAILVGLALLFKDTAIGLINRLLDQLNNINIDPTNMKEVSILWIYKLYV